MPNNNQKCPKIDCSCYYVDQLRILYENLKHAREKAETSRKLSSENKHKHQLRMSKSEIDFFEKDEFLTEAAGKVVKSQHIKLMKLINLLRIYNDVMCKLEEEHSVVNAEIVNLRLEMHKIEKDFTTYNRQMETMQIEQQKNENISWRQSVELEKQLLNRLKLKITNLHEKIKEGKEECTCILEQIMEQNIIDIKLLGGVMNCTEKCLKSTKFENVTEFNE